MIPRKHGGTPPTPHGLGGDRHSAATIAELEALLSDLAGNLVVTDADGDASISGSFDCAGISSSSHIQTTPTGNIIAASSLIGTNVAVTGSQPGIVSGRLYFGYAEVSAGSSTATWGNLPSGYNTTPMWIVASRHDKNAIFPIFLAT